MEKEGAREAIETALGGAPTMVFQAAGVLRVSSPPALDLVAPVGRIMALGFCGKPATFIPLQASPRM